MWQKGELEQKHIFRVTNLHQPRKFYTRAASDGWDIQKVWFAQNPKLKKNIKQKKDKINKTFRGIPLWPKVSSPPVGRFSAMSHTNTHTHDWRTSRHRDWISLEGGFSEKFCIKQMNSMPLSVHRIHKKGFLNLFASGGQLIDCRNHRKI